MSYNSSIPLGTDPTLQSQAQIRANFQSINLIWGDNHYPLTGDNNLTQGMHSVLTLRPQNSAPVTDATHVAFYNMLDANSVPEIFFAPNNAQTSIQLTYPSVGILAADDSYLAQQYSFSAGPFVIYAGRITKPTQGQVVTLSPSTNIIYAGLVITNAVNISSINPLSAIASSLNSPMSSFTINFLAITGGTFDVFYIAMGVPA